MSETSGETRAPWALRGLVVASVVLPLLVFAGGGWLAWRGTLRDATASLAERPGGLAGAGDASTRQPHPAQQPGQ